VVLEVVWSGRDNGGKTSGWRVREDIRNLIGERTWMKKNEENYKREMKSRTIKKQIRIVKDIENQETKMGTKN
jgi:hypothetical protein